VPETDGVGCEGDVQSRLALGADFGSGAVVDRRRGVQADARMTVDVVVVFEEVSAERPGVLDGSEPVRERRAVLEGLERSFGIRVVVALTG
jgi:Ethanolamine utilization protein EutJ (predicted chaperonin)